jgi:hypothetical protein
MASKEQKSSEAEPRVAPTKIAKPFRCDDCPKTKGFKTAGAKKRHAREEHGPNKYKCEYCGLTTKRRYQTTQHKEAAHPERQSKSWYSPHNNNHVLTTGSIASITTDISSNQGSRGSIDSHSSDEAAGGLLQPTRSSSFQRSPSALQPLPVSNRSLNSSEGYITSNAGISQHLVGPPYTANMSAASYYGNNTIPSPVSRDQIPPYTVQPSYSTMTTNIPFAQPSAIPWGASIIASQSTATAFSFNNRSTTGPPNHPEYTTPSSAPYYSGSRRGMPYNRSPYPSTSDEQSSPFSQSAGSSYIGGASQPSDWSQQPAAEPQ